MEKREVAKLVEAIRDHSAEYVHEDSKVYVDWELGNTALAMDAVTKAFEKWSSALREENARKDEALEKIARDCDTGEHTEIARAALSSARPAPAQEQPCGGIRTVTLQDNGIIRAEDGRYLGRMEYVGSSACDALLARKSEAQEQGEERKIIEKLLGALLPFVGVQSSDAMSRPLSSIQRIGWSAIDEARSLLARKPAELGSEGNPYKGTYNSVVFERHDSGLRVGICERDDGFEFVAHGTAGESSHYRLHPSAVFERLDRPSKPAEEVKPPSGMMSGGIQPCAEVEARAKGETK